MERSSEFLSFNSISRIIFMMFICI
jgi:hypothetical protein